MSRAQYTKIGSLYPEIKEVLSKGMTQREVAAGLEIRPKGRPRKNVQPRDIVSEQAYEIQRLKMENKLLRDFLQSTERK